ncbi:MAG: N-acetylmuramoyl-L-alanine amidase [Bacteroidetes bacterium]|nr:N-acetylmuramoyl-L-alanine amidase [Bacteroidota bacterium]
MAYSLTWLLDVLKNAGLKVAPVEGWQTRGRGDVGRIFGVLCHHTAGSKNGNMPSLGVLVKGRADLPGPLAQLGLGRDGTYYIIAAGRCNHAGKGAWRGVVNGNSNFIGIEAENTGLANDTPWPAVQLDAYHRGVAAILKHIGQSVDFCVGHKEFALPRGRKSDPNLDMTAFRAAVAAVMSGAATAPVQIPSTEPSGTPGAPAGRPTIRRGAKGDLVRTVQAAVGVPVDGDFGPKTEAAVRAFQREHDLTADGIVGPKTWAALDAVEKPLTR